MLAYPGPVCSPPSPRRILYGQHSLLTHIYPLQYLLLKLSYIILRARSRIEEDNNIGEKENLAK
jgi:hypothetical protein